MKLLVDEIGLSIDRVEYDSDEFALWASEEYSQGICLSDDNSYAKDRKKSIHSRADIKKYKKEIKKLNDEGKSDNAAFYISMKK
jgi:hypothetical protein